MMTHLMMSKWLGEGSFCHHADKNVIKTSGTSLAGNTDFFLHLFLVFSRTEKRFYQCVNTYAQKLSPINVFFDETEVC